MTRPSLFFSMVLLALTACRSDPKTAEESQGEAAVQPAAGPGPQITTIGFTREDTVLHYALDIKYPAIREHEVFNGAVRAGLEAAIDEFTEFIKDFNSEGREMRSEYQLVQNTSRVTSVRQMYEWAVPGVSTLLYRFHNVNYNAEAKELIPLESLFRDGVGHRPLLRKRLAEKIRSRFKIEAEVTDDDLQAFVIGPDYLEFYKVLYPEVMDPEPKAFQVKFSELEGRLK
ncbi:MAG: hypothetical protein KDD10_19695 [Phaeodactylibacter sp.]|nr:hypothetical protein [Phaeodactylibacter sp.]MCB9292387.1 hypothetical protein [Lewinellaceae bacterium]